MSSTDSMWTEASRDVGAERSNVERAKAMVALAEHRAFLIQASSNTEYEDRLALVRDEVARVVTSTVLLPADQEAVYASLREEALGKGSTKTATSAGELNSLVEFDSPFSVDSQGNVDSNNNYYAPEVYHIEGAAPPNDVEVGSSDWEVWSSGRSNQQSYGGGVMHASEQLSGGMAQDLLEEPGMYVVTTVETDDPDGPAGWIVLKHKSA